MNITTKHIPLHRLHCNKGQIVGLPQNPRHKDNNPFGDYDWDILANEWDDMPLQDWGVDMPDFSEPKEEKPKEAKSKETTCPFCGATF